MSARTVRRARDRAAFTLVEVMIALVVSGLVASLAYAAAQAGFDTEARVTELRDDVARDGVVRGVLADALRHQVDGVRGGAEVFALHDLVDAEGRAADSLTVITRGIESPMGASATWQVVAWRDGDTLRIAGIPLDAGVSTPAFVMALGDVNRFDVQALGRGLAARWQESWPERDQAPDAFALQLAHTDARSSSEPLVVRRGLERAP